MQPGDCYVLAIVVTALFVAPFNGLARVIVLAWLAGHVCFMIGVPERAANIAGQSCVLLLGSRHLRGDADLHAWALSLPLLLVNISCVLGLVTPLVAWWTILLVATTQLVVLSMAIDGATVRAVMHIWRENGGRGMFRTAVGR